MKVDGKSFFMRLTISNAKEFAKNIFGEALSSCSLSLDDLHLIAPEYGHIKIGTWAFRSWNNACQFHNEPRFFTHEEIFSLWEAIEPMQSQILTNYIPLVKREGMP